MTSTDILGFVTLGILFVVLLLVVFLLSVKTGKKLSNYLMAMYLVNMGIQISVFFYHPYLTLPCWVEMLRDDISLLGQPLIYLYVLSVLYDGFRLKWRDLWHVLPFVANFLLFTPRFYAVSEAEQIAFYSNYFSQPEVWIGIVGGYIQPIVYLVVTFVVLARYRRVLRENYSDASAVKHRWLFQLNVLLVVLYCFSLFKTIFKRFPVSEDMIMWVRVGMVLLLLSFLSWMTLKILLDPSLFRGVNTDLKPLPEPSTGSPSRPAENDEEANRLRQLMEQEQPYLDPELTIAQLAEKLELPVRELSELINQRLNRHFFDFVNDYRIEHAGRLLRDPANKKLTVLEVLYAVGFNSKSSFNVAFKNRTGLTPSAFRKQNRASD